MQRLGYDRFVAQGGVWGCAITNALGGIGAPAVQAVHFNMFPIYETMEARDAQEEKALKRLHGNSPSCSVRRCARASVAHAEDDPGRRSRPFPRRGCAGVI